MFSLCITVMHHYYNHMHVYHQIYRMIRVDTSTRNEKPVLQFIYDTEFTSFRLEYYNMSLDSQLKELQMDIQVHFKYM